MVDNIKIAEQYGMLVNPDRERVNIVLAKIKKIKESTGVGYCPCYPQHNKDTICPCKYMRTKEVCRCGLYIPIDKGGK